MYRILYICVYVLCVSVVLKRQANFQDAALLPSFGKASIDQSVA